jgi:hypothetical protein
VTPASHTGAGGAFRMRLPGWRAEFQCSAGEAEWSRTNLAPWGIVHKGIDSPVRPH